MEERGTGASAWPCHTLCVRRGELPTSRPPLSWTGREEREREEEGREGIWEEEKEEQKRERGEERQAEKSIKYGKNAYSEVINKQTGEK